jgi:hypothetical protein
MNIIRLFVRPKKSDTLFKHSISNFICTIFLFGYSKLDFYDLNTMNINIRHIKTCKICTMARAEVKTRCLVTLLDPCNFARAATKLVVGVLQSSEVETTTSCTRPVL